MNGFPWVSRATPQEEAVHGTAVSDLASCPIGRYFLSGIVNGFREFLWVSLGFSGLQENHQLGLIPVASFHLGL